MFTKNNMQLDAIAEAVKKVMAKEADLDETGLRKAAYAAHSAGQKMFTFKGKTYPVKVQGEDVTYGECMEDTVDESTSEKVPTSTGMKVYGHRYGDSKKARQDQTKHSVDAVKGPKEKDIKEEGDCVTEPEVKTIAKKEVKGHEKKMHHKEGYDFASRLINSLSEEAQVEKEINEVLGKDAKAADWIHDFIHSDNPKFAGKSKAKRQKMALAAYYAKQRNEEMEHDDEKEDKALVKKMVKKDALKKEQVELEEDNLDSIAKKHGMKFKRTTYGAGMTHPKHGEISINRYGEWHHTGKKASGDSSNNFASLDKHLSTLKEEYELDEAKVTTPDEDPNRITTDMLSGREEGGKSNSFKSFKLKLKSDGEMKAPGHDEPEETTSRKSIKAKDGLGDKIDNLDLRYGKPNSFKEEVELNEDNLDSIAKKHGMKFKRTTYGAGMTHPKHGEVSINRYGEWHHYPAGSKSSKAHGDSTDNFSSLDKHLSTLKEEVELDEETPKKNQDIADKAYLKHKPGTVKGTMTQVGRFLRGKPEIKEANDSHTHAAHYENDKGEWTGMNLLVAKDDEDAIKQAHEKCKEGCRLSKVERHIPVKEETVEEAKTLSPGQDDAPFEKPYTTAPKNIKDKSGAVHTPMSRAKDLARSAMKRLKTEMLGKAPGNN
jgi:hypothetical protein